MTARSPFHALPILCLAAGCAGTMEDGAAGSPSGDEPAFGVSPGTGGRGQAIPAPPPGMVPPVAARPASGGCAARGALGATPLRRLTHDEYVSTVRDLLRLDTRPTLAFPREGEIWGLTNNVAQQGLSPALIERYFAAAETLSAKATDDLGRLLGCDLVKSEDTCLRAFVDDMGTRAYRRPVSEVERQSLLKVYAAARAGADPRIGVRGVLEALLVSPDFLFRAEGAAPGSALDGWAVASRLSYLLWGTMPDAGLFGAARGGALTTPEGIAAQQINLWYNQQFVALVQQLKAIPEGAGNLLDSCLVWQQPEYGANVPDGDTHQHQKLPYVLAGKAGGSIKTGRLLSFTGNLKNNALLVGILRAMGFPDETFGDPAQRGALKGLVA